MIIQSWIITILLIIMLNIQEVWVSQSTLLFSSFNLNSYVHRIGNEAPWLGLMEFLPNLSSSLFASHPTI